MRESIYRTALLGWWLAGCATHGAVEAPADPAALYGEWQVERIEPRAVAGALAVTVELQAPDRILGWSGCNRYFGSMTLDSNTLTVPALMHTRMACPPDLGFEEGQLYAALEGAHRYEMSGHARLTLYDAAGQPSMTLVRAPAEAAVPQEASTAPIQTYRCGAMGRVTVQFPDADTAKLRMRDETAVLQRSRAASGAPRTAGAGCSSGTGAARRCCASMNTPIPAPGCPAERRSCTGREQDSRFRRAYTQAIGKSCRRTSHLT